MIINSLSGGRTSSYIAVNYPTDVNLFSLVCVDDYECGPKDPFFRRYAEDKLAKYSSEYEQFLGTAEDPSIFKTMYQLEQLLGKEIIWVRGESFDQLIERKKMLPRILERSCTTHLKIAPIFQYWLSYLSIDIIKMNIGYRYDEKERIKDFTTSFKYNYRYNLYGKRRNRYTTIEWREGLFPLIEDKILSFHISSFWRGKSVTFADDSNCQHCIFKKKAQIGLNAITCPDQLKWAASKEITHTWHNGFSVQDAVRDFAKDELFSYGGGAGCTAGECIS